MFPSRHFGKKPRENQFSPSNQVVEVLALRELRLRSAGGTDCQGVAPLHRSHFVLDSNFTQAYGRIVNFAAANLMRTLLAAMVLVLAVAGCEKSGPIPESDRRKYYGDAFIYQGAPFICLYVGLETNETAVFASNFWHFADQHDINKPKKRCHAYSGPPLATCKSDHVSVFVSSTPTTNIVARSEISDPISREQVSWQEGIWNDAYWPTNACRIKKDGQDVLAPVTGSVRMASNDTNYPLQDFKRLSEELTALLQAAFPDRSVRVFSYDGDTVLR